MQQEITFTKDTILSSPSMKEPTFEQAVDRIANYIREVPDAEYEIAIGTDSMTYDKTKFVMAIVLHNVGKGGIYFYKIFHHTRITNLHDKLYKETQLSLDAAEMLIEELLDIDENIFDKMKMSIHLDIGENGPTKSLIRELEGWVTAMGYDYAIKPDSYAASTIADLYSK